MPLPPYIASRRPADADDAADYQTMFAQRGGRGRRADRRAAFHARVDRRARCRRDRPRNADPARRRRHLPAGQGRRHRRAQDAQRMGPHRCRHRRAAQRRASRRRAADRGRDDLAPPDRKRRATTTARSTRSKATRRSSSRPAIASRRSTAWSPISICRDRPCSCWSAALMGLDVMKSAYAHAIREGYRFYSYGDASLLLPQPAK